MADPSPAKVPATFKALVPFIRRAEELDRDSTRPESKLIAYFCRQYAMEQGIKLREHDSSNEATDFLLALMDRLEAEKDKLPEFSQEEAKEICEDFAMEIFSKADDEDRAGAADKNTAKTFYAAGTFFDILNQFGEISEDVVEKRKYCKYKAATIMKALKEGQIPTPGPPDGGFGESKGSPNDTPASGFMPSFAPPAAPTAASAPDLPPSVPSAPQDSAASSFPSFTGSASSFNGPPTTDSSASKPDWGSQDAYQHGSAFYQSYQQQTPPTPIPAPAPVPASVPPPKPEPIPPVAPTAATQSLPARSRGSPATQSEIDDAIECAKFAIAALKVKDMNLAVQRLEMALRSIR